MSVTFLGAQINDSDLGSYVYTYNVGLGSGRSVRNLIVSASGRFGGALQIADIKVNGVSCPQLAKSGDDPSLWNALATGAAQVTGTSATIEVIFSRSALRASIAVYEVSNLMSLTPQRSVTWFGTTPIGMDSNAGELIIGNAFWHPMNETDWNSLTMDGWAASVEHGGISSAHAYAKRDTKGAMFYPNTVAPQNQSVLISAWSTYREKTKRYQDGAWQAYPLKVWDGDEWVEAPIKTYKNGSWQ